MKRAIASLLLLALGFATLVHPLTHGLEQNPELCAVAQLEDHSPALAVTLHLSAAPPQVFTIAPSPSTLSSATSVLSSPSTRGPPQA